MPIGIKVHFLNNNNNNNDTKSIVIIEVDKSIERPHQFDNRYYIRLDGQTRVAPHYLIKALMMSKDFPIIRGQVRIKDIAIRGNDIFLTFRYLLFNTSHFNNEKNVFLRIIAHPGNIYINHNNVGPSYSEDIPILSHGRPIMSTFVLRLNTQLIQQTVEILFQFGGEKSPSKTSTYKYNIMHHLIAGKVADESIYLLEKNENKLPSDVTTNTDDDNINQLLDL
jgi:hypothetical protein